MENQLDDTFNNFRKDNNEKRVRFAQEPIIYSSSNQCLKLNIFDTDFLINAPQQSCLKTVDFSLRTQVDHENSFSWKTLIFLIFFFFVLFFIIWWAVKNLLLVEIENQIESSMLEQKINLP